MPTKEIKDFPAVVTPAGADLLVTQQDADSVTRKMTVTQTVQAVDPKAHKALHQDGGADEISVAALSGLLADAQTALAHAASHISGGGDPFTSAQLLEAIVKRLQTSSGPTTLLLGAWLDTELLGRSGTAAVGVAKASQAEAEAGADNAKWMTALRVAQAITAQANPAFTKSFVSAEQTITAAGPLTIAHSLAEMPKIVQPRLINKTAELGYSIGDEVVINPAGNPLGGAVARGLSIVPDATNLNIRFGSDASTFSIINKTTGAQGNVVNANWKLIVRAYA